MSTDASGVSARRGLASLLRSFSTPISSVPEFAVVARSLASFSSASPGFAYFFLSYASETLLPLLSFHPLPSFPTTLFLPVLLSLSRLVPAILAEAQIQYYHPDAVCRPEYRGVEEE